MVVVVVQQEEEGMGTDMAVGRVEGGFNSRSS